MIVTIKKNNTTIWGPKSIAYNDKIGYLHDVTIAVQSNDKIYFIVSKNGNRTNDSTEWDPEITFRATASSPSP